MLYARLSTIIGGDPNHGFCPLMTNRAGYLIFDLNF